jgi:hypothetical protein
MLLAGCQPDPEEVWRQCQQRLAIGMEAERAEAAVGPWGRRRYIGSEESVRMPGWDESVQRKRLLYYHRGAFQRLEPTNLLETVSLADGQTRIARYTFGVNPQFPAGCDYHLLCLFYDVPSKRLVGYGLAKRFSPDGSLDDSLMFRGAAQARQRGAESTAHSPPD